MNIEDNAQRDGCGGILFKKKKEYVRFSVHYTISRFDSSYKIDRSCPSLSENRSISFISEEMKLQTGKGCRHEPSGS